MSQPHTFLQEIDTYILKYLTEIRVIPKIAAELNLSSSQIYRKIKKATGKSPSVYIRQKKLEIATIWILNTDWTLSQIAYGTGFTHLSYFSRSFACQYGYPPSILRKVDECTISINN